MSREATANDRSISPLSLADSPSPSSGLSTAAQSSVVPCSGSGSDTVRSSAASDSLPNSGSESSQSTANTPLPETGDNSPREHSWSRTHRKRNRSEESDASISGGWHHPYTRSFKRRWSSSTTLNGGSDLSDAALPQRTRHVPGIPTGVQDFPCKRYFQQGIHQCSACTSRLTGETCRFIGIRRIEQGVNGMVYRLQSADGIQDFEFPTRWNVPLTSEHIRILKLSVATALLPTLLGELRHITTFSDVVRRFRETSVRATCDFCLTSLFCGAWMCRRCGREACPDCAGDLKNLQIDGQQILRAIYHRKRNQILPAESVHQGQLVRCHGKENPHYFTDFVPVTRFHHDELEAAIHEMKDLVSITEANEDGMNEYPLSKSCQCTNELCNVQQTGSVKPSTKLEEDAHLQMEIPSHRCLDVSFDELSQLQFDKIWKQHTPLVVHGISHGPEWTPKALSAAYGEQKCTVVDCITGEMVPMRVDDFFSNFGIYGDRQFTWKLKDWPTSADFKDTFPELYLAFLSMLPMPQYTRRDGVLNLAAHFPNNTVSPDVGPKMYNAFALDDKPGSPGTTKLHMDMADAVNVMLHAEDCPDGTRGFAIWDIFRAEDSNMIRQFLSEEFLSTNSSDEALAPEKDPIHRQQHYLDRHLRQKLFAKYRVWSHRIEQRPGDAIFIPAGCAHQVLNRADCVKAAIDFVSPQDITICETLTREFRSLNYEKCWKDDVLQLNSMMWYTWLSCSRGDVQESL